VSKQLSMRLSTGVPGLDEVLNGGFIPKRSYLVRGGPGSGKTTLGVHYLAAGVANGEKVLFICLGESEAHIRQNAKSFGFDLKGFAFLDLSPGPEFFTEIDTYDIFSPAEVERGPITRKIIDQVEKIKPDRVFIDAIMQFRYLATDVFQFRKQVLSFLRFLISRGCTVLLTSESGKEFSDDDLQFLSDGVINLEHALEGRHLSVTKYRGSGFRNGRHFVRLTDKGMAVFPRLIPAAYRQEFAPETFSSGLPDLDELLYGGLKRGTITIISGPSGVGKTTVGLLFMREAARKGQRSVLYSFEEALHTLLRRSEAISIPVQALIDKGMLSVVKVEPLKHSPEEFAHMVRKVVEEQDARIVMIDSVSGYEICLGGDDLVSHLHALCKYMTNMGVTVILVNEVEAITGDFRVTEVGISYIADNIVFMRYLELNGELRKAIGVLKKRMSNFGKALRELKITRHGVEVGRPLTGLKGILSSMPELLEPTDDED
jgi:circadian clock protein KaiC